MDDVETWRWIWLGATGVFAAGEMLVAGSFFLAPFAVGAAVATVLAFVGAPLVAQWAGFVLVSLATFAGFRPLARRLDARTPQQGPVGATRLPGRTAVVVEAIPTGHGLGLVRVDREEWRAESVESVGLEVGERATVLEVRGTRLIVFPEAGPRDPYLIEPRLPPPDPTTPGPTTP